LNESLAGSDGWTYHGPSDDLSIAFVKPAYLGVADQIAAAIEASGLRVISGELVVLTLEIAQKLYEEHVGNEEKFRWITELASSGPIMLWVVQGKNVATRLKELVGPTDASVARRDFPNTIRGRFWNPELSKWDNCIHNSTPERRLIEGVLLKPTYFTVG